MSLMTFFDPRLTKLDGFGVELDLRATVQCGAKEGGAAEAAPA
jgi:hypothetical protein